MSEIDQIRKRYRRREYLGLNASYTIWNPHYFYELCKIEFYFIKLLAQVGLSEHIQDKQCVEIGCGTGEILFVLRRLGVRSENLLGIDLIQSSLGKAQDRHRELQFLVADGSACPIKDGAFDIVVLSTVFTSIQADSVRFEVANEIGRILRRGGYLMWYDFIYDNPRNPDVKAVTPRERASYFKDTIQWLRSYRVTVLPPLARRLTNYGLWLLAMVEGMRVLNTHEVCIGQRL